MSKAMRFFWLVTLVTFSGGCSSYRMVSFPYTEDEWEITVGWESSVKVGDEVRITLTDNGKVVGRIMAISLEALNLDPIYCTEYLKYPENLTGEYLPRVIEADSIRVMEKRTASVGNSLLFVRVPQLDILSRPFLKTPR